MGCLKDEWGSLLGSLQTIPKQRKQGGQHPGSGTGNHPTDYHHASLRLQNKLRVSFSWPQLGRASRNKNAEM